MASSERPVAALRTLALQVGSLCGSPNQRSFFFIGWCPGSTQIPGPHPPDSSRSGRGPGACVVDESPSYGCDSYTS